MCVCVFVYICVYMYIRIYLYIYIYIYIYIFVFFWAYTYIFMKLCVSSFEILYFNLNDKENKVRIFTEHFQTKNTLLYQCGGYRVIIQSGVTVRGMWFQTSWNFHPFLQDFCLSRVFERKYYLYLIS